MFHSLLNTTLLFHHRVFILLPLALSLTLLLPWKNCQNTPFAVVVTAQEFDMTFPRRITLRAATIPSPPYLFVAEKDDHIYNHTNNHNYRLSGFSVDLIERLKVFALEHNVTLNVIHTEILSNYSAALDRVANDCNTTHNPNTYENCNNLDIITGNFFATPSRSMRAYLTPSWQVSPITTAKYTGPKPKQAAEKEDSSSRSSSITRRSSVSSTTVTTFADAQRFGSPICVNAGALYAKQLLRQYPDMNYVWCNTTIFDCIYRLRTGNCSLYAKSQNVLSYLAKTDPSIEVTGETLSTNFLVWPMTYKLDRIILSLIAKWIFDAVQNGTLGELYFKYFDIELCPLGKAGLNCDKPCDPVHGKSDKNGNCVCDSIRFTGTDCSIERFEEVNSIPHQMLVISYIMVIINVVTVVLCAIWLRIKRASLQVRIAQPTFLSIVLLGCLISTSTIITLAQEHTGHGPVPACMAIPWLYSVGFSITFGALFAKILRVHVIYKSSLNCRVVAVSVRDTLVLIALILLFDVTILITWTLVDPLVWHRSVITMDKFGYILESQGHCVSDQWRIFTGLIALLHLILLGIASFLCYVTRNMPTFFSQGKYLAIAMVSNLQIFIIGLPVLIIVSANPVASFFVRSVIIWMNDFVVVTVIFGNLIYSVHKTSSGTSTAAVSYRSNNNHNSSSNRNNIYSFATTVRKITGRISHHKANINRSTNISMPNHIIGIVEEKKKKNDIIHDGDIIDNDIKQQQIAPPDGELVEANISDDEDYPNVAVEFHP